MMIVLYLRTIRDHQTVTMKEMSKRIETIEGSIHNLLRSTAEFEREYATKEEWVRESMLARQRLEKLTEMVTRIETELENGRAVTGELGKLTSALTENVRQGMGQRGCEGQTGRRADVHRTEKGNG
jgi:predicted RNase H-like nuclease (RuvC/YqgF family)